MITALYIAICALIISFYKTKVILIRRQYGVWHGDGGYFDLQLAIRIERYAVDIFPMACLLILMLEMNSSNYWPQHILGITVILSRIIHAWGLKQHDFTLRRIGMGLTIASMTLLALLNIYYIPWFDFLAISG